MLTNIIENVKDEGLLKALTELPIYRLLYPENIQELLRISSNQTAKVIQKLSQKGFIQKAGPFYRFHDLLKELIIRYNVTHKGQRHVDELNVRAAKAYLNHSSSKEFGLMCKIEPFYHLYVVDTKLGQEYFEPICKAALDRKDRVTSYALLNEIDFSALPKSSVKGWFLLRLGGYYREFRNYQKAIEIFDEAMQCVFQDNKLLAYLLNNIGWVYLFHKPDKNINQAIKSFEQSNEICQRLQMFDIIAMNLNNLGIAHERKKYDERALESYKKSLDITESEEYSSFHVAAKSHRNISTLLMKRKMYAEARNELDKAILLYNKAHDIQGIGESIHLKANMLVNEKKYTEGRKLLDEALCSLRIMWDPYWLCANYFALSKILCHLKEEKPMLECMISMCRISLQETWDYHLVTVHMMFIVLKMYFTQNGKQCALKIIEAFVHEWDKDNTYAKLNFSQYIKENITPILYNAAGWSVNKRNTLHKSCGKCKPYEWNRLKLVSKDEKVKFHKCKKCW